MYNDVYYRLRDQLDQYSVGFPTTRSGVEMKILEKLFTEEEAEMYLNLSMMLETPQAVAERTNQDQDHVAALLEGMAEKGLIFRLKKGESAQYGAVPFVIGFYEFQLKTMDQEFAQLVDQYFEEAFLHQTTMQTVPLRTIPVGRAISVSWPIAPYEDLRGLIKNKDLIAVANCICRMQKGLLNQACEKPLEVCFLFGSHGKYYVDREMARWISQDEAIEILGRCEEAGLVPQPLNAQNPGGWCNCCGDCCAMLRALKRHPRPSEMVVSNYYATVDPDLCAACETCLERCQMDAITIGADGVAEVNRDRCIGCGLCVTTCTTEALSLQPKPQKQRREPPATPRDTMLQTVQERGKTMIPISFTKGHESRT
jgi:electron transport complex protein RnfB